MTSKREPKWTDETLSVQKRKQLLAQELARMKQRDRTGDAQGPVEPKPVEKSEKPVAGVLHALRRHGHAMA